MKQDWDILSFKLSYYNEYKSYLRLYVRRYKQGDTE